MDFFVQFYIENGLRPNLTPVVQESRLLSLEILLQIQIHCLELLGDVIGLSLTDDFFMYNMKPEAQNQLV